MKHAHHVLIRWPTRLLKGVAWLVIVCFTVNTITPGVLGAQTLAKNQQLTAPSMRTDLEATSDVLIALEEILDRIDRRVHGRFEYAWQENSARLSAPAAASRTQVSALQANLTQALAKFDGLHAGVTQSFTDEAAQLRSANLPAEILDRVQAQKTRYDQLCEQLKGLLAKISSATTESAYKQGVADAHAFLAKRSSKPRLTSFDPAHLPFTAPRERPREPLTDPAAMRAALNVSPLSAKTSKSKSVASGKAVVSTLFKTVNAGTSSAVEVPADLAQTEDIQITDAVRAKAAELHNNPLEIYQWVRNNVEFTPTYGSILGSAHVLDSLHGNAFDQASLLIALLRTAGIHSRYAYGVVEVPIDQVLNWVGGAAGANAALNLLGQGGIPALGLTEGGVIKRVRMEHVWVEAYVDYIPSRGAKHIEGDSWISLDPSFKQSTYNEPLDIGAIVGADPASDAQNILQSAVIGNGGASISGINQAFFGSRVSTYQGRLAQYASDHGGPLTMQQAFGSWTITPEVRPYLPAALPYPSAIVGSRFDALPAQLRHSIRIELFASQQDQALDSPSLTKTISLPALSEQRIGITYVPATSQDAAVLSALTGNSIPLYSVHVKPEIQLDGVAVAQGPAIGMGQDQPLNIVLISPSGGRQSSHLRIAGDEMVIGVDAGGVTPEDVSHRFERGPSETAAENLHSLALHYWAESDLFSGLIQSKMHVRGVRMPSAGVFSSPLDVVYNFGIPSKGSYLRRNVDIGLSMHAVAGRNQQDSIAYVDAVGVIGSYLESSVQEQLFKYWQGTGLSTIQSLVDANAQGIPIYVLTQQNAPALLPHLNLPADVMNDITSALARGLEVSTPESTPNKSVGSKGIGYELRDPQTGSAAYLIRGGTAGGDSEAPCAEPQRVPLTQYVFDVITTLVILAMIALLIAIIVEGSGGLAIPALGPLIARMMLAFGLTSLSFAATAGEMYCNPTEIPHKGGNPYHDHCADTRPGNIFVGWDACVSAPVAGTKAFDAWSGSTLWEVKAYNMSNHGSDAFLINVIDKPEWEIESRIARECHYNYRYTVGDTRHATIINEVQPGFVPTIADELEVDPANCLPPAN